MIDVSTLTNYYNAQLNLRLVGTSFNATSSQLSSTGTGTVDGADLPWRQEPDRDDMVREVLSGRSVFPDSGRKDALEGSDEEKLLFAYTALDKLKAVADAAAEEKLPIGQESRAEKLLQKGLQELRSFVEDANLQNVSVLFGEQFSTLTSEVAISRSSYEYTTGILHEGDFDSEVAAFTGDRQFNISVTKSGTTTDILIDLSEMGVTLRNLDNVVEFINGKLDAVGFATHFERTKIGVENEDGIVEGNSFGFTIDGNSTEKISFSAVNDAEPAVYMVGVSGAEGNQGGQVTKWTDLDQADPTLTMASRLGSDESDTKFIDLQVHPDGGFVAVGTSNGTLGEQTITSEKDLVLTRYDSQGKVLWTRALGASDSAEATSISISSTGRIAVSGVTTSDLVDNAIGGGKDGFITVYDSDGIEEWTYQRGSQFGDTITSVKFADDGSIYLAGQSAGTMTDGAVVGGKDAYVRKLDADGSTLWTRQYGTTGDDGITDIEIASDGALIVSGTEDGQATIRRITGETDDGSEWLTTLGSLGTGRVNDIALDDSDQIFLVGETRVASGEASVFTGALQTDMDGFVARMDANGAVDWETRVGGAAYQSATGITVYNGVAYVSGTGEGVFGSGTTATSQAAFVSQFDATTGAQGATGSIGGRAGIASGQAIAFDTNASATLDAFGLPEGELVISDSAALTDRLPLRAGDHFYLTVDGGNRKKITIEQGESMRSLSFKINAALVLDGKADVRRGLDGQKLKLTPADGVSIEITAGDSGKDALEALGLVPGVLVDEPVGNDDKQSDAPEIIALELAENLSFIGKDEEGMTDVIDKLDGALRSLRTAYRYAINDPTLEALQGNQGPGKNRDGVAPAYLTARTANMQAGLNRLLAGSGSTNLFA